MKDLTKRLWQSVYAKLPKIYLLGTNQYALVESRKAYARLMGEGQAQSDLRLIESGQARFDFKTGEVVQVIPGDVPGLGHQPILSHEDVVRTVRDHSDAKELRQTLNVIDIVAEAAEQAEASNDSVPIDKEIDEDWLWQWQDHAERVSNKELQSVWAKVLLGELRQPGSVPLRLMDFISKLTTDEAQQIARIMPFILDELLIYGDKEVLEKYGFTLNRLMSLAELGVINFGDGLGLQRNSTVKNGVPSGVRAKPYWLITTTSEPDTQYKIPAIKVTALGLQIYRLSEVGDAPIEYLRDIAAAISKGKVAVTLARMSQAGGDLFRVEKEIEVFPAQG